MAWTQDDVDKLKKAIASGTESFTLSNGFSVRKRPIADLGRALALAEAEVAGGNAPGATVSYISFSKG